MHRFDGANRLAFLSLHDPEVARRWPDLEYDDLMEAMYVIDGSNRRYRGADAFRYLTRRLPKLWILAPALHLPGSLPFWRAAYRWVAQRRYRWGKVPQCDDDGACHVHLK